MKFTIYHLKTATFPALKIAQLISHERVHAICLNCCALLQTILTRFTFSVFLNSSVFFSTRHICFKSYLLMYLFIYSRMPPASGLRCCIKIKLCSVLFCSVSDLNRCHI